MKRNETGMNVQIIEKDGRPEWAVIPYADYLRLVESVEDVDDIKAIEDHLRALDTGEEEMVPAAVADRLLKVANPIKVWRECRGLTAQTLAERAGISTAYLSQLESGAREGDVKVLAKIARVLAISLDDLMLEIHD